MASISLNAIFPSSTIFSASARHVGNAVRQQISTTSSSEDAAIVHISRHLSRESVATDTAAPDHNSDLASALAEVLSAAGEMVQQLEKVLLAAEQATPPSTPLSSEPKAPSGDTTLNLASFMKALHLQAAQDAPGGFFAEIVKSASHAPNSTGVSLMEMLGSLTVDTAQLSTLGKIADVDALSFSTTMLQTPPAGSRLSEAPIPLSFSLAKIATYESSGYEGSFNALDFKVAA